jgi:hypothetical protein
VIGGRFPPDPFLRGALPEVGFGSGAEIQRFYLKGKIRPVFRPIHKVHKPAVGVLASAVVRVAS